MRVKKILVSLSLILFFFFNNFFIFAQEPPTPTPTYALFEDTNKEPINIESIKNFMNIPNQIDNLIFNAGANCGHVGQACCGKKVSPTIDGAINVLSGGIASIIPGAFSTIQKITIPMLVNTLGKILNPIVSKFINGLSFFQTEDRGYCVVGYPSNEFNIEQCTCVSSINLSAGRLCGVLKSNDEQNKCFNSCMKDGQGIWTALGCFSSDFSVLIRDKIFGLGISFAGMISFLCIIYAAFQIQSSQGNAEKIKKAQELLTSCIMGLIVIIFSVFILKVIGVNILRIPGFN